MSENEIQVKRLKSVLRHISKVRENCELLAERLMEEGRVDFALQLIQLGLVHDNSKLSGIEWEYLHSDVKENEETQSLFFLAHRQHIHTNKHHPEYWGRIKNMPEIHLAEWVCDVATRASEFGTDLREWIKNDATKRFDFTLQSQVYKTIKYFVDLLLDPKFK